MNMWDKEKFFHDYVEESKQIKPDQEFVQRLKKEVNQKAVIKRPNPIMKYTTIAACFLLCIIVVGVSWNIWDNKQSNTGDGINSQSSEIHAGKNDFDVHSGEIESKPLDLADVITFLEDENITVEDKDGNMLPSYQRKKLLDLLNSVEITDENIKMDGLYTSYFCIKEEKLEIKVYEDGYLTIGNSNKVYKTK